MVVLLDLDDKDAFEPHADPLRLAGYPTLIKNQQVTKATVEEQRLKVVNQIRSEPNINGFSAALGCYPIVSQLTRSLDLNTLHALSHTCRRYRAILLHFRNSLIQQTLRCEYDVPQDHSSPRSAYDGPDQRRDVSLPPYNDRLASGKIGPCARDMVGDCQRCGVTICRVRYLKNCAQKPPTSANLPKRHRRLCHTCQVAPLSQHTRLATRLDNAKLRDFVPHGPCACEQAVYLCIQCGSGISHDDTTYRRIWTWRTRYSTYLGGLGTGVGEGNEGVKCARKEQCLGAQIVHVEGECPSPSDSPQRSETPDGEVMRAGPEELGDGAGYWRQEVEGIGGVVKKIYKRRVRVGAPVREWEDEREGGQLLGREVSGEERSWCGWCKRVIPGKVDREEESKEYQ